MYPPLWCFLFGAHRAARDWGSSRAHATGTAWPLLPAHGGWRLLPSGRAAEHLPEPGWAHRGALWVPATAPSKCSTLAPTFTPSIMCCKAIAKPPSPSPRGTPDPASVLPLREVAGVDGLVRVHVLFSLSEISQIERKLVSYTPNFSTFIKEFQYITQSYSLAFHDVHMILANNLLPEVRR